MTYLLDANVLMAASRYYYAFDLAPGFWTWIEAQHVAGRMFSVPRVRDEITTGDALSDWAERLPGSFWRTVTARTITSAQSVMTWSADPALPYSQAARDEFRAKADSMLIAEGHASNLVVVTHEVAAPDSQRAVKIPDACRALAVSSALPFDVFRTLGLRLTLDPG